MSYTDQESSRYSGQPLELYRFTAGVEKWLYCSGDTSVTYSSDVYAPEVITRTEIDQSQEQQAGNIEVSVPRDNAVSAMLIPYLPTFPIGLTIYRKHRSDSEVITAFVGKIISVKFNGSQATLTCAPLSQVLQKKIPVNVYQSPCNHALYSPRCGVDKNAFATTGVVQAINAPMITVTHMSSHADGYYRSGYVQRTNGDVRFITGHAGNNLTLQAPFNDLQVGETVTAYAGCDRSETTCATKFSNLVNHLGFARIPTLNPFQQSIT